MSAARTLVISPNWIGDAVMAQPLLQLLKAAHPERPIDVLAPPAVSPVWRQVAEVEEVLETPFRHGALQLKERWKYARMLAKRGYADAYILPNTIKYALIPWLAGIPRRIGYKGESRYGMINVMHHDEVPARPMIPFYAALALPPVTTQGKPALPKPKMIAGEAQIAAVFERHGIDPARPLVAVAPGAEFGGAKRWPGRHFAGLMRDVLQRDPSAQIVLLGSPKDKEACTAVAAGLPADAAIFNLAGATTLAEAVALLARVTVLVTNDSGLMHVASAQNRPVLALYGPTDYHHTPPFSEQSVTVSLDLECAPCQQRECPLGHHDCMVKLTPDIAWRSLQPLLPLR